MKKPLFSAIFVVSLLLSACGQLGLDGQVIAPTQPPTPVTTVAATSLPPTSAPTATAVPVDPATLCPTPGAGQAQYISHDNGYCFLYPSTFNAQPDFLRPAQAVDLTGAGITQGQDTAVLHLGVASNGAAAGLDSQTYAAKWVTAYRMDPSVTIQPVTFNGQAAALIDDLPGGMFNQRLVFVVANGFKYQVSLSPLPSQVPQLAELG